ncbi:unnamed protein product [Rotaria sp. Silwood2]|nr:unnamed protein product [Rotaria sp. Silwood2]CAF4045600.1 unnamed protein product [Rotaria sp. Silwood2]CAF4073117.1 unnamed protein product [Rotaria sp. Silwood2]CAF4426396.1 unnamed protein product [Rotaria sp. Silwood2]
MPSIVVMRATSSIYSAPHMDKQCDKTITLNGDTLPGIYFSLTSGSTVSQRIIIVVDNMDIACGGDKLLIYDGQRNPGSLLNLDDKFQCGTHKYYLRTPTTNTVIIEFIANNDGKVGNGFILNVAINFPVATCSRIDDLYRCKNLFCISNIFNCDDRNWCGDNTQKFVCR